MARLAHALETDEVFLGVGGDLGRRGELNISKIILHIVITNWGKGKEYQQGLSIVS